MLRQSQRGGGSGHAGHDMHSFFPFFSRQDCEIPGAPPVPPCNVTVPFSPALLQQVDGWVLKFRCFSLASCPQESNKTSEPEGDESTAPWCISVQETGDTRFGSFGTLGDEPTCRIGGGAVGMSPSA